ncbi:carboxypeptidase regulatory-like domain-containing protein [Myxococcus sp. CA056]|uniref:carboxypeptidase regulatory-like domain-containing protein n=1 Tax=Myxococcus sp. CA056 TaxID=2741740 RepID=UPI00157A6E84|nr:carboxypeptidase regulatory-like domain-containing protein [Myxococcus sp. CA056]NTX16575.1 carboxypeptidase regulatory-like domain-containing protein [Myxococcus sp. CA056]
MSPSPRPLLLTALVCALGTLAGCGMNADEIPGIPGDNKPLPGPCAVDQDCPNPSLFICNTALSRCEPACRTREDCEEGKRQQYALPMCDNPLGCQCDMNRCVVGLCAADADCGVDEVCRDGACGAPPAPALAASCQVTPEVVVGSPELSVVFGVWVKDASGRPVVPRDGATWSSLSPMATGGGTGVRAAFTLRVPGAEQDVVEARVGSAVCRARVMVLSPDVPDGGVRVLVFDELTGRPLPLASVAVSEVGGKMLSVALTGLDGVAWVPASGTVGLSAFHPDFGYLTLARHDVDDHRDVRMALRRNPQDFSGGVRVDFVEPRAAGVPAPMLRLGMTGLSVPGLFSELASGTLLGFEREVEVSAGGTRRLPLPSGTALWLEGGTPPPASAPGVAGICDGALAGVLNPEEAILSGTCGTRAAWGLTGSVPVAELPLNALEPGADPLLMLGRLLPLSPRFYSSVARDAAFRLVPTPGLSTGEPRPDTVAYSESVSLDFEGVRLAFPFAMRVPELPRYRGTYLDRAYVVSTVVAPGRGLVPLGLGAAANVAPADPNTDADVRVGRSGVVALRMAPAHHGLEGQPYRLLVGATSRAALDDASAGTATGFVVADLPGLTFDPLGEHPVEPTVDFLPIPEDARYNFDGAEAHGLQGRELRAAVDEPATLVRVVFTDRLGRRWTVLASPDELEEGIRVPRPPAGIEDRTYFGDHLGSRALLRVEVLQVTGRDARDTLGPSRLVAAGGPGLDHVGDLTRAASSLDVGRPEVTWLYPELEGQRLSRGSAVRVRVTGFRPGASAGADGRVRVMVRGGGKGCEEVLVSDSAASPATGEVQLQLPANCSGTGVSLIASLEDTEGALLRPPVFTSRGVDIP